MKDTKEEKPESYNKGCTEKVKEEKQNIFEGLITVYYKGQTVKVL